MHLEISTVLVIEAVSCKMSHKYCYFVWFFFDNHLLFSFRLETDPETLTDLSNSLNLLERIQTSDVPNIESQFKPLNDQFNMLHQHEVLVSEIVETQHKSLQSSWTSFQQCLVNADSRLKKHKVVTLTVYGSILSPITLPLQACIFSKMCIYVVYITNRKYVA